LLAKVQAAAVILQEVHNLIGDGHSRILVDSRASDG